MEGSSKVTVNGREYTVRMFSPIQAHEYWHSRLAAEKRTESLDSFYRTAIGQCLDSIMRPLSEAANFLQCFSEHPEDLFPLGRLAEDALLLPFLSNPNATGKTGKN
jgi:hypothetical protein